MERPAETIIIEPKDVRGTRQAQYRPNVPKPHRATAESLYQVMLNDHRNMQPDSHSQTIEECQDVLDYFRWANGHALRVQKAKDAAWEEYADEQHENGTMPNRVR